MGRNRNVCHSLQDSAAIGKPEATKSGSMDERRIEAGIASLGKDEICRSSQMYFSTVRQKH